MKTPTKRERDIYTSVVKYNQKISDVACQYACSPSTIRRACDTVSEFNRKSFSLEVSGEELTEIIGWLRNGNTTSAALADKIESM